jgi:cellulose biosynthesis protein BcsQ
LGQKVLLVDLDPQAGLTISYGFDPETVDPTIDIIRNNCGDGTHSNIEYRNVVLKLCKPHAISITRSSNWALVLRKTS